RRAPMRSSLVAWRGRANIAWRESPEMRGGTVGFRAADGSKQPVLGRDVTLYARCTARDLMPSAWRQGGLSYARRAIRHRGAAVWSGARGFSGVCLTLALVACSSPSPPPIPPGVAQAASPIATAGAAAS